MSGYVGVREQCGMSGAKQLALRVRCLHCRCFPCLASESAWFCAVGCVPTSNWSKKYQLWEHVFWFNYIEKESSLHTVTALGRESKHSEWGWSKDGLSHKANTGK